MKSPSSGPTDNILAAEFSCPSTIQFLRFSHLFDFKGNGENVKGLLRNQLIFGRRSGKTSTQRTKQDEESPMTYFSSFQDPILERSYLMDSVVVKVFMDISI